MDLEEAAAAVNTLTTPHGRRRQRSCFYVSIKEARLFHSELGAGQVFLRY